MYIMTENGYRPLVSFASYWDAKNNAVREARQACDAANKLPIGLEAGDETSRKANCHARDVASRRLQAAYDALLG